MALTWNQTLFEEMYTAVSWGHGIRGSARIPSHHYHWFAKQHKMQRLVDMYIGMPGFAQVSHVAIIGGAFGWTAELLASHGITAISVDTSDYIVANENVSEEAELRGVLTAQGFDPDDLPIFMSDTDPNAELPAGEIWNRWLRPDNVRTSIPVEQEDMANNGSRNRVKQRLSNSMDAIITEGVLESQETDAESLQVVERCEQLRPNPAVAVVHLHSGASNGADPRLNFHTAAEWRALLDANGYTNHTLVDYRGNIA